MIMILIAAGSSLPFCGNDSQQIVLSAFFALGRIVDRIETSPLYLTPAWPDPADPPFINAAAVVTTGLDAKALLEMLHALEAGFGRRRTAVNAPRTLDLDLIAYGDEIRDGSDGGPVLPHPRLEDREFVLAPLCDIAPDWLHPATGLSVRTMLNALPARQARRISC